MHFEYYATITCVVLHIETNDAIKEYYVSQAPTHHCALNLDSDGGGHFVRNEIDDRDAFA